ncbi:MAG: NUDIX hydrolase [Leptonema sp. (in: Bacteria)]|nr:NUDIX hydrolase [Leptonema sp. (in: bacteria)]
MKPGLFQITVKLFLWHDQSYLALKDTGTGYGDLPGGRIGSFEAEDIMSALKRELEEELGSNLPIEISKEPVTIFYHFVIKDQAPAFGVVFEGKLTDSSFANSFQLSDEHSDYRWLSIDSDPSKLFFGTMLDGVKKYLSTNPLSRLY